MGCGPSKPSRALEDDDGAPYTKPDVEARGKQHPAGGVKVFPTGPNRRRGRRSESDDDGRNANKTASLDRSTKNRGSILRDTKDRAKKSFSLDRRNAPSLGRFKYGNDKGPKNSSTDYLPGGGSRRGRKPSGDGKPKDKLKKEEKDISSSDILAGAGIAGTAAATAGVTAAMAMKDEETLKEGGDEEVNGPLKDFIGNGRTSAGADDRRHSTGLDSADDALVYSTEKVQEAVLSDGGEREIKTPVNEIQKSLTDPDRFRTDSIEQGQDVTALTDSKSPRSPTSPATPVRSAGSRSPPTPVRSAASRSPTTPVRSATSRTPTTPARSAGSRSPSPPVRSAGSKSPTTPVRSAGSRSPTTPERSATPKSPTAPVHSEESRSPATSARSAGLRSPTNAVLSAENGLDKWQENTVDSLDVVSQENKVQRQDSENVDSGGETHEAPGKDSDEEEHDILPGSAHSNRSSPFIKREDSQEGSMAGIQDSTEKHTKESEESVMDALNFEARNEKEKLEAVDEQIEENSGSLKDAIGLAADEYDSQKHLVTNLEEPQEAPTTEVDFTDNVLQESQKFATEAVDSTDILHEVSQGYTTDVIDSTANELEESQEPGTNVSNSAVTETEESRDSQSGKKDSTAYEEYESQESAANENVTVENVLEGSQGSIKDIADRVEEFPGPAEYTTDSTLDKLGESQDSAGHTIDLEDNKFDGYRESTEDNLDSVAGRFEESLEYGENKAQEIHESSANDEGHDKMQESTPTTTERYSDEGKLSQDTAVTYSKMTDEEDGGEEEKITASETIQKVSESAENSGEEEKEHSQSFFGSLKEGISDFGSDAKRFFTGSEDQTQQSDQEEPHGLSEAKIRSTPDVVEPSNTVDNQGSASDTEKEALSSSDKEDAEDRGGKEHQNEEPIRDDDDDVETRTSFFGSLKNSIVETVGDIKDTITGDNDSPREEEKTSDSMNTGLAVAAGATAVAAVGAAAASSSLGKEEKNVGEDSDAPEGGSNTGKTSPSSTTLEENEDEQGDTSFFSSVKNSFSNAKNFITETAEDIKESITGEAEEKTENTVEGATNTVVASTSSAVQGFEEEAEELKDSLVGTSGEIENKVSETLEDAKVTAEDVVSSAGNEVDQLKGSAVETVNDIEDTVSGKVEGMKEDVVSVTSAVERTTFESYKNVTESVLGVAEESKEGVQELADTAQASTTSAFEEAKQGVSSALATGERAVASSLPTEGIFTATPGEAGGSKPDTHDNEAGQGVLAKDDTGDAGGAQKSSEPQDQTSTLPREERRSPSPSGLERRRSLSSSPGGTAEGGRNYLDAAGGAQKSSELHDQTATVPKEERRSPSPSGLERRRSLPSSPRGPAAEGDRNYLDTLSPFWETCSQTPEKVKEEQEGTTDAEETVKEDRLQKSFLPKDEAENETSPSRRESLPQDEKEVTSYSRRMFIPKDEKDMTYPARRNSIPEDVEETLPARRKFMPEDDEEALPTRRKSIPKDDEEALPPRRKLFPEDDEETLPPRRKLFPEDDEEALPARRKFIPEDDEETLPPRRKIIPEDDEKALPGRRKSIPEDDEEALPARREFIPEEDEETLPPRRKFIPEDDEETLPTRRKYIPEDDEESLPARRKSIPEDDEETLPARWKSVPKDEKEAEEIENVEEDPMKSGRVSPSRNPTGRQCSSPQKLMDNGLLPMESLRESVQLPSSVGVFMEKENAEADTDITPEMQKAAVKIQSSYKGYKTRKEFGSILKKKKTENAEDGTMDQEIKLYTPRSPRAPVKSFSFDMKVEAKEKATKDSLYLPPSVDEYMGRIKEEERNEKEQKERLKAQAKNDEETMIVSLTIEGGVNETADETESVDIKTQEKQVVRGSGNKPTVDPKKFPATSSSSPGTTRISRGTVESFSFEVKDEGEKKENGAKKALQLPSSVDLFTQNLEEENEAVEVAREQEVTERGIEAGGDDEKNQVNKSSAFQKISESPIKSFSFDIKNEEPQSIQSEKEILTLSPSVSVFMEKIRIEEEGLNSMSLTPESVSSKKQSEGVGEKTTSTLDVPRFGETNGASSDSEWADLSSREVSPAPEKFKNSISATPKVSSAESNAATKIQALYRGYTVRKRLKKGGGSNRVSVPSLPHGLQKADSRGKYWLRTPHSQNHANQSHLVDVNSAASKIQAGFRGYKVRKALKMLQKSHDFHNIVKSTKRRSF